MGRTLLNEQKATDYIKANMAPAGEDAFFYNQGYKLLLKAMFAACLEDMIKKPDSYDGRFARAWIEGREPGKVHFDVLVELLLSQASRELRLANESASAGPASADVVEAIRQVALTDPKRMLAGLSAFSSASEYGAEAGRSRSGRQKANLSFDQISVRSNAMGHNDEECEDEALESFDRPRS